MHEPEWCDFGKCWMVLESFYYELYGNLLILDTRISGNRHLAPDLDMGIAVVLFRFQVGDQGVFCFVLESVMIISGYMLQFFPNSSNYKARIVWSSR